MNNKELWCQQATRWNNVKSPTRPTQSDIKIFEKFLYPYLHQYTNLNNSQKVVVLGVTPEIIQLPWPDNISVFSFDLSKEMIDALWDGSKKNNFQVHQCDWRNLPLLSQTMDLVIGDGVVTAVGSKSATNELFREVSRVLCVGSNVVLRCFVQPKNIETIDQVVSALINGEISNFGSLKWRIAMALVCPITATVAPSDIYSTFCKKFPDRFELKKNYRWSMSEIETIDSYSNMKGIFYFPTQTQLEEIFSEYFKIDSVEFGDYELSERCPIYKLLVK